MPGVNQPARLSKRSRASDTPQDKSVNTDGERVKRRRFSENGSVKKSQPVALDVLTVEDARPELDDANKPSTVRWSLSRPAAGLYGNLDPIFTSDEEYLFLGLETAVQIYYVSTSRLFRTLQMHTSQQVVAYRLCSYNQEHLYVFTSSGFISKWEWKSGKRISRWDTCCKTISVDLSFDEAGDSTRAISFFLREVKDGKREISITPLDDKKVQQVVALQTSKRLNNLKVAARGRVIVACDGQHLLVGASDTWNPNAVETLQYTWREAKLPVNVTSLDIREKSALDRSSAHCSKNRKLPEAVDLVIGEAGGSILILSDVLNALPSSEDDRESGKNLTFRRLHWHRGPVSTVRWSKDGQYIISGGNESVMVLWQLDTGRKQFLPHLSSPICNIVVSPTGNSYATKLADNSIMVLSARELQPYATITGLQLSPQLNRSGDSSSRIIGSSSRRLASTAAVLHPQHPDQLLIAVPASHQSLDGRSATNSPILQAYDVRTNNHLYRQALARTNATTLKVSPEGTDIVAPDITHLDVSHDGKWLATIDDWHPSAQDIKALDSREDGADANARDSQEIFLKFWKWNSFSNLWELATRIDRPHCSNKGPESVLSLASRPHSHEFATIGSDAILRFWCPAARQRSGLKSRDDEEQQSETWKCRSVIDLKGNISSVDATPLSAASMSFSEDGSVLGLCLQSRSVPVKGLVCLVDAQKGEVCQSRDGIYPGGPCATKFLGRHLIIASNQSVSVWDTVDNLVRTVGSTDLSTCSPAEAFSRLLAVNAKTQTFAVATQDCTSLKKWRKNRFHVQIYDIRSLMLQDQPLLRNCPLALLSDPYSGDYVVLDAAANVLRITCLDKASQVAVKTHDLASRVNSGLSNLFGGPAHNVSSKIASQVSFTDSADNSLLHTKGFTGIFGDGPSFNMPHLSVLFKNVVDSLASS